MTRRSPGLLTVLRWELVKLWAQARSRYLLVGCLVAPPAVVAILNGQQRPPKDTLYGRWIHTTGYAMPLLVLAFGGQWVFPLLASLIAGDIFAGEDGHGTWKTILTRSVSRSQVFWAKTAAAALYTVSSLVLLAASTIASSLLIIGTQPLTGLTAQQIGSGHALWLVIAAWATAAPVLLGFTALAVLLSIATRNSSFGVVAPLVLGLVMTLLGALGGFDLPRRFLLTTGFDSWHGFMTSTPFYGPFWTGLAVAAGWTVLCLSAGYVLLRRRDITEG
jgi:ABC-2 type transport system permease protein